jgi:hypothetical protein
MTISVTISVTSHTFPQVVTKPDAQYKAWYGLPATPEVLALDPDYDEAAGESESESE